MDQQHEAYLEEFYARSLKSFVAALPLIAKRCDDDTLRVLILVCKEWTDKILSDNTLNYLSGLRRKLTHRQIANIVHWHIVVEKKVCKGYCPWCDLHKSGYLKRHYRSD